MHHLPFAVAAGVCAMSVAVQLGARPADPWEGAKDTYPAFFRAAGAPEIFTPDYCSDIFETRIVLQIIHWKEGVNIH